MNENSELKQQVRALEGRVETLARDAAVETEVEELLRRRRELDSSASQERDRRKAVRIELREARRSLGVEATKKQESKKGDASIMSELRDVVKLLRRDTGDFRKEAEGADENFMK